MSYYVANSPGMGDFHICTSAMCSQARASITQMRATFDRLVAAKQLDRTKFESTLRSIEDSFNKTYSRIHEWIPFSPRCCAVETIGKQADDLTQQMLKEGGVAAPLAKGPSSQPDSGGSPWSLLFWAGLAVAGAFFIRQVRKS